LARAGTVAPDQALDRGVISRRKTAVSLAGSYPGLRALLLEAVPGEPDSLSTPRPRERERTSRWLEGVLVRNKVCSSRVAFAHDRAKRLAVLPPEKVPCHGDYYVHNWLVDAAGTVRIIDFDGRGGGVRRASTSDAND